MHLFFALHSRHLRCYLTEHKPITVKAANSHARLTTPFPIRTSQFSKIGHGSYMGDLLGNTTYCSYVGTGQSGIWTTGGAKIFCTQAQPASCTMGTGSLSQGVKQLKHGFNHPLLLAPRSCMCIAMTLLPLSASLAHDETDLLWLVKYMLSALAVQG